MMMVMMIIVMTKMMLNDAIVYSGDFVGHSDDGYSDGDGD
jgi:hypothetical protein